jgi:hypothetical protein
VNNQILNKNYVADAAIPAHTPDKFTNVDGHVLPAAAECDSIIGVSGDIDAALGERVDVIRFGIAPVVYGGAVTRGDLLTSDASGHAITATRHTHTENTAAAYTQNAATAAAPILRIIGVAEESGVAGDVGSTTVQPAFA